MFWEANSQEQKEFEREQMSEEARITNLEIKISHQDLLLEELHQVVYKQQQTIDALEKKIISLTKRFEESGANGIEIRGNEKPPHYWNGLR